MSLDRTTRIALLCAVLMVLSAASPLKAGTIFTNFGSPGQTFVSGGGYLVGYLQGSDYVLANSFVAAETATLTDAMLGVQTWPGYSDTPGSVTVYVESDSGGVPGTILDTLTTGSVGTTPSILTFTCSICSQLVAGTEYFLVASEDVVGDGITWDYSDSETGSYYFAGDPTGPWVVTPTYQISAFQVDGTPTTAPEPNSIILLLTGVAMLRFLRSRSRTIR